MERKPYHLFNDGNFVCRVELAGTSCRQVSESLYETLPWTRRYDHDRLELSAVFTDRAPGVPFKLEAPAQTRYAFTTLDGLLVCHPNERSVVLSEDEYESLITQGPLRKIAIHVLVPNTDGECGTSVLLRNAAKKGSCILKSPGAAFLSNESQVRYLMALDGALMAEEDLTTDTN